MLLFDEDRNGLAVTADILRVLQTYTDMTEADRERFVKICAVRPDLTEEELAKPLKDFGLAPNFKIKEGLQHLFNI